MLFEKLRGRGFSRYLTNTITDYYKQKWVEVDYELVGVPQGSVLELLLWKLYYDEVLQLSYTEDVTSIGSADDLAIVAAADYESELK